MRNHRKDFLEIGTRVSAAERSLDEALGDGGTLLAQLVSKRIEIGVSAVIVQPLFQNIVESLQTMMVARKQLTSSHLQLKAFRKTIIEGPKAYGDCCGTPSSAETEDAPTLRVVN